MGADSGVAIIGEFTLIKYRDYGILWRFRSSTGTLCIIYTELEINLLEAKLTARTETEPLSPS